MSIRLREVTETVCARVQSRTAKRLEDSEAGMVASEYALGTAVAACTVGVLFKVVSSDSFLSKVTEYVVGHFLRSFN